ncbi:TauD/TfdA family dioxygenase [Salibacterium sp. K-3]
MAESLRINRKRRKVVQSNNNFIKTRYFQKGQNLPLVMEPNADGVDIFEWVKANKSEVTDTLHKHGGILFRDCNITNVKNFHLFINQISGELLEYSDNVTPRSTVKNQIYTSTDFAKDQHIELHNEMAYSHEWPMKIFFYCDIPAQTGGETPIADSRRIYEKLDPTIIKKFSEKNVMYVRNLGLPLGVRWQDAFQTEERKVVEEICKKNNMNCIWKTGDHLRIEQVRPAITRHPVTDEPLWFNQISAFHLTTLNDEIRQELLHQYDEQDVPKNSFYGDGTSIEREVLQEIREVYTEQTVKFPWQKGDILMLDNMMVAHGRTPYTGDRKTLVGMTESKNW